MKKLTTSSYTGHGNCRRCGDEIPPYRYLCDVCRAVPDTSSYEHALHQERERIIEEIKKLKEKTRQQTGAFKYDFAYDEIIKTLKQ